MWSLNNASAKSSALDLSLLSRTVWTRICYRWKRSVDFKKEDFKRTYHEQDQLEFNSKENATSESLQLKNMLKVVSELQFARG